MGNTESNVTSGVKKQAGTSEQPVYKLVNLKGKALVTLHENFKKDTPSKKWPGQNLLNMDPLMIKYRGVTTGGLGGQSPLDQVCPPK